MNYATIKFKDGWYISTNGIVHKVEDNHYLCNQAVGLPVKAIPFNTNHNFGHLCVRCLGILEKRNNIPLTHDDWIDRLGRHHNGFEYAEDERIKCHCGLNVKRIWLSIYDWEATCKCGLKYYGID